jgi:hypothetical protein
VPAILDELRRDALKTEGVLCLMLELISDPVVPLTSSPHSTFTGWPLLIPVLISLGARVPTVG